MKHLKAVNKYFWKYRFRLGIGILFIIISNYFGVLAPQVTGFVIDYVQRSLNLPGYQPSGNRPSYDILVQAFIAKVEQSQYSVSGVVALSGITILILALLRGLFMFLMRQTIIVMSRHIEYDQKNEVFAHYQKLDTSFFKSHSVGDLMSRMAEDVSRVRMFTGPAIMYVVNLISLISLSLFFMFRRDVELTLYVLAPLPVLAATIYLVNTIIHRKSEELQATLASLTTNAQQSYSGIRVIKSFAQETAQLRFFEQNSETYKRRATELAKVEALYFPSMTLFIGLSTLLTIMIGGLYYINGQHNIGIDTIVEFVIYINLLTFPVSAIGWTASMVQRASASQKRLNEFLDTKPAIQNNQSNKKVALHGPIEFRDVNFIYPHTNIHALKNFNLEIKPGERIAIIGRTGSGKSTLAQLLLRMYDVTSGEIILNGVNIKDIELQSLRQQISYVPQDGFLFSDTIENNIAFGAVQEDKTKVEQAAALAVVDRDIAGFPEKYKTVVGERGVTLSGGQKQRVSIARALMKEAPVLILDDALSAVDARTEKAILSQLDQYLHNKTSLFITHRIFNLINFHKIIVLENGRIAEQGTHAELLAKEGIYTEMYAHQMQENNEE
ncbi:ABC transporter ATP-binding protein/permease [Chitinophagaceae bacterium LB-8]|uniref:ABC transporter ATP-binding protein/permease n=1 Tax=Paraflavisolibacter caeni TaxID=2982496 RepID=A0A9X2XX23_9BACT|nr:ABC transporter ATP-binding protein [Paraflavisolibacter caeni]MCU7550272.1 ABC transporter ATP-binding protein/permease [Paraflavisolibacter caeni]